jgi:acetyltransferase-like isoleucine patch superfamily enzyme
MGSDVFVHHLGSCETSQVGAGTRIWAFAHVLPGAVIGVDCNICDHVFIENDVVVGDRVTVKSGVQLWDGIRLADDVFVGPNTTFTNDRFPRSKRHLDHFAVTIVHQGASLGANCTILPGITIGARAMVGAGAVVTRDVPPRSIVTGSPARIRGYLDEEDHTPERAALHLLNHGSRAGDVPEVVLQRLARAEDMRGRIAVAQVGEELPFVPQRIFMVHGVPSAEVRGEHAHRQCKQFLICVSGNVTIQVDNGDARAEYVLSGPNIGLYIPPLIWSTQFRHTPDAVLVVLASDTYDPDDYIREYGTFLATVRGESDTSCSTVVQ